MLQRLFSRGTAKDRIGAAVERSAEMEQRDILRERSATILGRLEHRKAEARRAERARLNAEREAVEREAAEFEQWQAAERALPEAMADTEHFEAHEAEPDVMQEAEFTSWDEEAVSEDLEASAPYIDAGETDVPVETLFADDTPRAAVYSDDDDDDDEPSQAWAEEIEAPLTHAQADDLFRDSAPLRDDFDRAKAAEPPMEAHPHASEAVGHEHWETHQLADEDPEVYEQLRLKAEEAKARIARRLEMMKDAGKVHDGPQLIDLGAAAPPLAMDGDED